MSDVVIRAEGLGKKFLIGHETERGYATLRDVLARTGKGFARSVVDMARGRQLVSGDEVEDFWALKDVFFKISRGEVVGIIGRNGAGKSTLLKILSRITEPSKGRVEIRGRVASLLEVGTGFHPELTGRENIYLNGAILGMTRAEISRKFDEIVAFADVQAFIDTPVKRYSSGMYVRLAFAVAAHLDPDILVVDEVLSVGDAQFQKRSLGKMQEAKSQGRTIIFVSHNLTLVRALCTRALYLNSGRVDFYGDTSVALSRYNEHLTGSGPGACSISKPGVLLHRSEPAETSKVWISEIAVLDDARQPMDHISTWDTFTIRATYHTDKTVEVAAAEIHIQTSDGIELIRASSYHDRQDEIRLDCRGGAVEYTLRKIPLSAGSYILTVGLARAGTEWLCVESIPLCIYPRDVYKSGYPPMSKDRLLAPDIFITATQEYRC